LLNSRSQIFTFSESGGDVHPCHGTEVLSGYYAQCMEEVIANTGVTFTFIDDPVQRYGLNPQLCTYGNFSFLIKYLSCFSNSAIWSVSLLDYILCFSFVISQLPFVN